MKFSERYGYLKPSDVFIREQITPEIQNAICNCYDDLNRKMSYGMYKYAHLEEHIWCYFLNKRKDKFWQGGG